MLISRRPREYTAARRLSPITKVRKWASLMTQGAYINALLSYFHSLGDSTDVAFVQSCWWTRLLSLCKLENLITSSHERLSFNFARHNYSCTTFSPPRCIIYKLPWGDKANMHVEAGARLNREGGKGREEKGSEGERKVKGRGRNGERRK